PLANGSILTSQAAIAADGGLAASASQSTTVQSAPVLAVSKIDDPDPVPPTGNLTYTIDYANSGTDVTTGGVLTETYDPSVTFLSATPAPDAGTTNRWTIGTLGGGAAGAIQVTVQAPAAPNGTLLSNTVTMRDAGGRSATATQQTTVNSSLFTIRVADPANAGQSLDFTAAYGNISGVAQAGVVLRAAYDPNFVVESAVPPPDAGTTDAWTLGTLASASTGQVVVHGFFGSGAGGRIAQTTFRISNPGGVAGGAAPTHLTPGPPLLVKHLTLHRNPLVDVWTLRGRFTGPTTLDPTGQSIEVSILGPGGITHTNPLVLPAMQTPRPGHFKFLDDVPGNGHVAA